MFPDLHKLSVAIVAFRSSLVRKLKYTTYNMDNIYYAEDSRKKLPHGIPLICSKPVTISKILKVDPPEMLERRITTSETFDGVNEFNRELFGQQTSEVEATEIKVGNLPPVITKSEGTFTCSEPSKFHLNHTTEDRNDGVFKMIGKFQKQLVIGDDSPMDSHTSGINN
ncbi:unnamed protein product [Orchesella dallaii]|uniref:Uncharacterized protein n=1 Tax=Orchesella dallaii TaxID=48710 RepID=A0ABP1R961_9HEXA